jgi:hypothetical protein
MVRNRDTGYFAAMVPLLILVIVLASLGILGSVVEGLLWLTAIALVLGAVAAFSLWTKLTS